jgi:cyclohexyl-isocyanide hydratase
MTPVPADRPLRIGAVLYPRRDQIDLAGPFAVLSRLPNASIQLLWKDAALVRDHRGLGLMPDATFAAAVPIDVLMITGGPGQEDFMEDDAVLSFIAQRAAAATLVFSVCTGALLCGAAGLLKGRRATTHWASFHLLKYFGATPTDRRVVVDGNLVTAAGLTAGIDGALKVASMLRGEEAAKAVTLDLQYAPEPPFDCGTPQKAPPATLERVRGASAKLTARRLATARRAAARLGVRVDD